VGTFSIWHWLIVLLVVVVLFGTKKLRNAGQDLGEAVRGFKKGVAGNEEAPKLGSDGERAEAEKVDQKDKV